MTNSSGKKTALFAIVMSVAFFTHALAIPVEEFGRSVARALQEGDGAGLTVIIEDVGGRQ